jgi:hypothetical protein
LTRGSTICDGGRIGGKEVHDPALMCGDLPAMVYALGVL